MDFSINSQKNFNFSFFAIILINTLFFSGYYILKDPLAYILFSEGIPLKQAYSITTTANILLALSSLFFGFTLHNCGQQKHSLFIGILLSVFSIFLLSKKNIHISLLAIAFYIVGGGLYFFNIVMFINRHFDNTEKRIRGNYIYQIFVNFGAAIGCILFLTLINTNNVFKYCQISGICSLIFFLLFYSHIKDEPFKKINFAKFYAYLVILFAIVYSALFLEEITRYIVILSFIAATSLVLHKAHSLKNKNLFTFISLVFLFSIPYWIANTVIFNEFFYFLTKDVSSIHGISPASLIIADPLINTLFGTSVLLWQRNHAANHLRNLSLSSLLMIAAFIFLSIGLYVSSNKEKINFFYPLVTMGLFACSEFLLQTTLNSRIRDLLSGQPRGEFLATGIMRSSRAFATVVGYYLIILTTTHTLPTKSDITTNFNLYLIMVLICLSSYFGYKLLKNNQLKTLI